MNNKLLFIFIIFLGFSLQGQEISDTSFGKGMLNFVAKDSTFSIKFAPRFQLRSMSLWDYNGESYNKWSNTHGCSGC